MRRVLPLLVLLSLALAPAPLPKRERCVPVGDIEGTWKSDMGPKEEAYLLKVTATHMTYRPGANNETVCVLSVDRNTKPTSYDISHGPSNWAGIYRVEGDTLTLCYSGSVRPTA